MTTSEWYYKSEHQSHGPFSAAEILRLAADGHVLPQDFVRKGTDGSWTRLAFCEEELRACAESESPRRADPTASVSPASSSQRGNTSTRSVTDSKDAVQNGPREGDSPILLRGLRKIGTVPGRFRASQPEKPSASIRRRHRRFSSTSNWTIFERAKENWGVIAAVGALLIVNCLVLAIPQRNETHERYVLLKDYFARSQRLRDASAPLEEWNAFAHEAHEVIDPLVADLQKHADVQEPIDQHLLWMARDYLLPSIDDQAMMARDPQKAAPTLTARVDKANAEFQNHVNSIEWILQKRVKRAARQ